VSHALARLRDLLGDELFIKGPDGMVPTAKARIVGPRLRAGLLELQSALTADGFDPTTAEYRYNVAANPYACAILLPKVVRHIRSHAPGVEVRVSQDTLDVTEALETGRLDLAVGGYSRVPEHLGRRNLLHDRLVWVLRADHPSAQEPLTLERLADLQHVVRAVTDENTAALNGVIIERGLERRVAQDGDSALTSALAAIGRQRQVRLTVPNTHTALAVVGETDLAALVPWRLAKALADHYRLRLMDPPYPGPETQLSMVWHLQHGASPVLKWLLDVVGGIAGSVDV
jgi:DNA-binding transcriptional LysR family regulator